MQIKNYTSGVTVESTLARIEAKLAAAGASGIMKIYDDHKQISALIFTMKFADKFYSVRLPANAESCYQAMLKQHRATHRAIRAGTPERIREQAARTAWRLIQDWVDVQISMLVMQQAEFLQVFLPYLWDGKQTYYDYQKSQGFKALPEQK